MVLSPLVSESADDVPLDSIEASVINNKTVNLIKITWLPPHQPNGFVITYELQYRRAKDDVSTKRSPLDFEGT